MIHSSVSQRFVRFTVAVAGRDDGLPPAIIRAVMGDHELADGDCIPGGGQSRGRLAGRPSGVVRHR